MKLKSDLLVTQMKKFPGEIVIDPEDFERFRFERVYKTSDGYVNLIKGRTVVGLHQAVTDGQFERVDHINGKPWDCRKSNLRGATNSQNVANQGTSISNKSGFKGVHWNKKDEVWVAQITVNKRIKHLGSFKSAETANEVYKMNAKHYFGEFAPN